MQNDRGKDRYRDRDKQEDLGDKQREERTGVSKAQRRREIAEAWHGSDSGPAFIRALEERAYYVARGDDCSYAVMDLYGEVSNLARQIDGVKTKALEARLGDREKLVDVATAQDRAREQRQALLLRQSQQKRGSDKTDEHAEETQATAKERREALHQAQTIRREQLDSQKQRLAEQHDDERKALADLQSARSEAVVRARAAQAPKGVLAFLARITGFNALTAFRHERQDQQRNAENRQQTAALRRRHRREMQNFRQQDSALTSLDKRERRSLETELRREALQQLVREGRPTIRPEFAAAAAGIARLRKSEDERKGKLKKDFAAAAKAQQVKEGRGGDTEGLKAAAAFNRAAKASGTTKGDLQRAFEKVRNLAAKPAADQPAQTEQADPQKIGAAREKKEDLQTRKPRPPGLDRDRNYSRCSMPSDAYTLTYTMPHR